MSVFPNITMNNIWTQILFYQFLTLDGLTFGGGSDVYKNYSFSGGMLCLFLWGVFYTFLGFYLDQVIPKDFGVSKKWYFPCVFCCQKNRNDRVLDAERTPLNDEEIGPNKDTRNFEQVSDSLKR